MYGDNGRGTGNNGGSEGNSPNEASISKVFAGIGLIVAGFITAPEGGVGMIGLGIALLAEGFVTTAADLMGGDTGSLPTGFEMLWDIGVGVFDYNFGGNEKKCK